jgi:hypothetical protein
MDMPKVGGLCRKEKQALEYIKLVFTIHLKISMCCTFYATHTHTFLSCIILKISTEQTTVL